MNSSRALKQIRAQFSRVEVSDWLLALLVLLSLLPLWLFPFFPSQDGPAHVENAEILLNYSNSARPELAEFYALNFAVPTNWLGHLVLAALISFTGPLVGEKLFLSMYVLVLPLAARYALLAINRRAGWLALAILPFVYSFVLFKGFYNFSASLPLYFFLLGYWLRHRANLNLRAIVALFLLSLLLYAAHVVSWVMLALALLILTCWFSAMDLRTRALPSRKVFTARFIPMLIILSVPTLLLLLFITRGTGQTVTFATDWGNAIGNLVRLTTLVAFDAREYWLAALFALGIIVVTLAQLIRRLQTRHLNEWDGFLFVFAAYFLLYLIAPPSIAGGSFVKQRLMLFPYMVLVLWLGAQSFTPTFRRVLQIGIAACVLGWLWLRIGAWSELTSQLQDIYTIAPNVTPHSRIVSLVFSTDAQAATDDSALGHIRVLLHSAGYLAATRASIELTNYEARTDYFPLRFRPSHLPKGLVDKLASGAPTLNLEVYERETLPQIDFVLLLAEDIPFSDAFEPPAAITRQLKQDFTLIKSPRGHAWLYQRKP